MTAVAHRPLRTLAIGAAVAAIYVVVAWICLYRTTAPEFLRTAAPVRSRNIDIVPYVVLAALLLGVGLASRRWWQAVPAPVVLVAGGWWTLTWLLDLPRRAAENDWTPARVSEVATVVVTTSHVVLTATVVVGWSLIRRADWWWVAGLLPSAVLVAVGELAADAFDPGRVEGTGTSLDSVIEQLSHVLRRQGVASILITTAVVVGSVWLCVLAERLLPRAPQQAPLVPPPPPFVARPAAGRSPSVADELAKLVRLREAGELDQGEFDRQKARLLEQ